MKEADIVASDREDGLLEDKHNFDEQKKELVRDYEGRLEILNEKLRAAQQLIQAQGQAIKTLTQTNTFLMSRLKDEQ